MVDRFLQWVYPYQTIDWRDEWGYQLFPTYLPLTWIPFIIPELLGMDYRWFAITILLLSVGLLIFQFRKNYTGLLLAGFFAVILLRGMATYEAITLGVTIETMIAGFYLLFILSWQKSVKWKMVGGVLLCLLSRYSLVIWLPLFFLYLWKEKSFRFSYRAALLTLGGVLLIYVLPFLTQDWRIFKKGLDYHAEAAIHEWNGQFWQEEQDRPYSLYHGVGLANLFYEQDSISIPLRLKVLQKTHLSLLIFMTLIMGYILWRKWFYIHQKKLFLLGTFKIYLAFFYHFIQIPYTYLFIVLIIVDLPLIIYLTNPLYKRRQV